MLGHNQGDVAGEGRADAGTPLAGSHRGVCGHHAPRGSGLVYPGRLSRSIPLQSAVRWVRFNQSIDEPETLDDLVWGITGDRPATPTRDRAVRWQAVAAQKRNPRPTIGDEVRER
jgi:hypothetical protein